MQRAASVRDRWCRRSWLLLACCAVLACGAEDERGPAVGRRAQALAAHCAVNVVGFGSKDVESDYLPNVVNCENGDADSEQLKAQAVAARTYLYYKLGDSGDSITSGTSNQVYSCARAKYLAQKHYDAVNATAGQVLMHGGLVIWSCFNAGSARTPPDCQPTGGGADSCITYNEGKSGSDVTPSPCGSATNPKNRGCLSQNGGNCLSLGGRGYVEILRYYYGADIELVSASGSCVTPPADAAALAADAGTPAADASASSADGHGPARDAAAAPRRGRDGGETGLSGFDARSLYGGCALAAAPAAGDMPLALVLALALLVRRARSRR